MGHGSLSRLAGSALVCALFLVPAATARARTLPDLRVQRIADPPHALAAGQSFSVRDLVRNAGHVRARRFELAYYLSRHGIHVVTLGHRAVRSLRPRAQSSAVKRLHLPAGLRADRYRLVACADSTRRVRESHEGNNCRASRHVLRVRSASPSPLPVVSPTLGLPPAPGEPVPGVIPVTLDVPADGAVIASSTPQFSGRAAAGSPVEVVVSANAATIRTLTAQPAADGSWSVSYQPGGLANGDYSVQAQQTDAFGRFAQSVPHSFRVAASAPALGIQHPADGSSTNDTTPTFDGTTDAASTVHLSVFAGSGADGPIIETIDASPAGGAWSVTPASALPAGDYTAIATQTDAAGNGATAGAHFSVDTTAPALSIQQPSDGSTTADSTPTFSGTTDDSDTVRITVFSGSAVGGAVVESATAAPAGGSWSASSPTLANGQYTLQAQQTDAAGNTATATSHVTVDTSAPLIAVTTPADGSRTNDTTPTVAGTTDDDAAVHVSLYPGTVTSGTPAASGTVNPSSGNWSFTPSGALPQGDYTAVASQTSAAGKTGTGTSHFTVDTTPPALTATQPDDGTSTNDTTPALGGATDDATDVDVRIYTGSSATGTPAISATVTPASGGWSFTPASALAAGAYTLQARQTDVAGNVASATNHFTIDTTPPGLTFAQPAEGSATNDSKPGFSGSTDDSDTVQVSVHSGSTSSGPVVSTATATPSAGGWSTSVPSPLGDGAYTAVASQTDAAGNSATSTRHFTVDTTAPALTLGQPVDGSSTNDTTPTYSGTTDDSAPVHLSVHAGTSSGPTVQSSTISPSSGSWSVAASAPLAGGTYTAVATETDAAGNATTAASRFTVDVTAPTLTIEHPPDGSSTSDTTPTVDGTTDDASSVHVSIYAGSSATGTPAATATVAPAGGNWSITVTSPLAAGTYTVQAQQTDAGGNAAIVTSHFTIDVTAPSIAISHPADGTSTSDPTPTVDGAASESTTVQVQVYAGSSASGTPLETASATPSGGQWSANPVTQLPEGSYTVQAQQTDAAGNTGSAVSHFAVTAATMLAAGDIGGCETGNDAVGTEALLQARPSGIVQTLGDNVYGNARYDDGSLADFQNCYGPNWGVEKMRTKPAIGNHEYNDPAGNAKGYWDYWDGVGANTGVAGDRLHGWYSYDLGAWHVVVLNANCTRVGCGSGSNQETWLRGDLVQHPNQCTLAVWHQPLFTSDAYTGRQTSMQTMWQDLQNAHADVVLNGHAHEYERFRAQDASGAADPAGIVEFVVGTGGESHSSFGTIAANSVVHDNTTFGILQLTLHQTSYDFQFVPAAMPASGGNFTDAGSGVACHSAG